MPSESGDYVPGQTYRVPCIRASYIARQPIKWWPVIGPEHEDMEFIGFPWRHWHVDYRFLSPSMI